jgi:hypothetical protein
VTNAGLNPRNVPLCSPEQCDRHRQAVPAQRLGQAHDVGDDPGLFEAEERPGPAAAHLHVVHDEQQIVPLAQIGQTAQPLGARGVQPALPLHRFNDRGRRFVETAAAVLQHALQQNEVGSDPVQIVVVRHRHRVVQRDAGPAALGGIAGHRERAERHAVEGVGEIDDRLPAGVLAGQFQGRLHRVGATRSGELDLVVESARCEHDVVERLEEAALGRRVHVEAVHDRVFGQVVDQLTFKPGMVVSVVQRARAGEEIKEGSAVLVLYMASPGGLEHCWPVPAVAAYF